MALHTCYVPFPNGVVAPVGVYDDVAQTYTAAPIPTIQQPLEASGVTSVTGTFSANGASPPFTPPAGRPFNFWAVPAGEANPVAGTSLGGTVTLVKSPDGGETFMPITGAGQPIAQFTTVACETAEETQVGVEYKLVATGMGSQPIYYGMSA